MKVLRLLKNLLEKVVPVIPLQSLQLQDVRNMGKKLFRPLPQKAKKWARLKALMDITAWMLIRANRKLERRVSLANVLNVVIPAKKADKAILFQEANLKKSGWKSMKLRIPKRWAI